MSKVLLGKLLVTQLVTFYTTRWFTTVFAVPLTGPYPEPSESSPHPHTMFVSDPV